MTVFQVLYLMIAFARLATAEADDYPSRPMGSAFLLH